MESVAQIVSEFLKAFASKNRLMILCQLAEGERSVGELADAVGMRPAAVSQQLALMRKDGLIAPRREGQTIHYSLASEEARALMEMLYETFCAPANSESPVLSERKDVS